MQTLQPRDYYDCSDDGDYRYCRNSAWNDWIRWVILAVVIIGFFLLFILCSCITARRRRRMGRQPYYGTGWAARPVNYGPQPYYNNNYQQPPPQYTAQPPDSYYGANAGYYQQQPYGHQQQQQQGVELQSPPLAHARGADDVYAPPSGPPPGKGDGIIR